MKNYLVALTVFLLSSSSAIYAKTNKLEDGDYFLKNLRGKLLAVDPLCPKEVTCFTDGTVVTVQFGLLGCKDRLGPVEHEILYREDNSVDIFISAINILNEESLITDCVRRPTENYSITMVQKFFKKENIRLHFLGAPTP